MKEKRTPEVARPTLLSVLALLVLFAQSPGGVSARDPLPAAQGGAGWSGTINIRRTYDLQTKTSQSGYVNHRSDNTTYTVNDLTHTLPDPEDFDKWEARGPVSYTSQMESTTAEKSPGHTYDETVQGSGSGKMYLVLSSEHKQFRIDIFSTEITDPQTHEKARFGDTYKATVHSVSWDSERNPQTITSTHQSDQSAISTPGTFNTLQPSGGNTVRLSGTRTVSEGSETTVYSWNLSRIGLEVVITPPKDLPKWVPKGSRTGKAGSSLTFKGEVRARGGGGGGGDKDSKVTLTIGLLSSALFGICNNYPPMGGKGKANSPDLKIQRAGTSKQFKEITEELIASGDYDFRITAKGEFAVGDKFTLVVDCYDYGAYGLFSAESQVLARIEGAAEPVLDLPADENKNHIADDWEQNNVGPDGGTSASSDDDSVPQGAGAGDGLTLFEEYRGFMVKGNHVRTKPSIKDLFVCSSAPGITDGGVELFGKKTGIKVRRINADEMMDQVVNFQAPKAHIVDEKAVSIQIVTQKAIDDAWGSGGGFEHPGGLTFPGKKLILLMKDTDMETIAHEMGHAVWIDHHGDGDYDLSIKDCTGSTPLCDQKKTARNKLKGFAASLGKRLDDVFIAVMHGENSGSLTCFMRYNSADFIEFSPGRFKPYGPAESNLSIFCNDKSGTKCGDAARGECLKQIRVSDKGN